MKRFTSPFFFLLFFLISTVSFAQTSNIWSEEPPDNIKNLKFMTPTELEQQFLSSQKLPAFIRPACILFTPMRPHKVQSAVAQHPRA